MEKNLEITKKSLETLIQLEKNRNSRLIPGQYLHETGISFQMQSFGTSTFYTYFHTSGSVTRAKAYQSIVFEKVDQEYFLSKTAVNSLEMEQSIPTCKIILHQPPQRMMF